MAEIDIAVDLARLRALVDDTNDEIMDVFVRRLELIRRIDSLKISVGVDVHDPYRERDQLERLRQRCSDSQTAAEVEALFREIFRLSRQAMARRRRHAMLVSRGSCTRTEVRVGDVTIGSGAPKLIAGPCAMESVEQLERIAAFLSDRGVRLFRAGLYKPRTSPYSFQGVRGDGIADLVQTCRRFGLRSVTEVVDSTSADLLHDSADMLQIGARNMFNYDLLRFVARLGRPVLLKRSFMATIEELMLAAEYLLLEGCSQVVLCERGIRTFERATRNTLDLSAVAVLRRETHLPVIVDLSHACGRTDLLPELARASLAVGADGLMLEVHHEPSTALSDGHQQLDFSQFENLVSSVGSLQSGALVIKG